MNRSLEARRAQHRFHTSALGPALLIAAATCLFHAAVSGRYGFHRDELYYLAAGRHPALGYVDHPPLVPLLARGVSVVLGEHLWPLRVIAGAVHAAVVVVCAMIARELGGTRWAATIAALAAATAPVFVATGSLFQAVPFDQLWWAVVFLLVVRLLRGADQRWWLGVGAIVGVGLQTKWTMALLCLGLAAGFAAVPEARRHLRSPWAWAGAAIAAAVWLPNLIWQIANDWPTLTFAENNNASVRAEDGRLGFLLNQVLLIGPLATPLAVAGFGWLWNRRPCRTLAIAMASIAVVLLVVGGKAYYLAPAYVPAFAAGAIAAEGWAEGLPWRRPAVAVALCLNGLIPLGATAPVLPIDVYAASFYDLNDELGEELGWPTMVDQVARVRDILQTDERAETRIITASYGEAAALDLYGPSRGVPRGTALSGHNSYVDWWPDDDPPGTVLAVRYQRDQMERFFEDCYQPATVSNPWRVPNEVSGAPILLCRGLRVTPDELRRALTHFE